MENNKKSILLVSSADPMIKAGTLAFDYYKALLQNGYDVDFLTLYKVKNNPEIISVYPYYRDKRKFSLYLMLPYKIIKKIFRFFIKKDADKPFSFSHIFFYEDERIPPVSNKKLESVLPENKKYDLIITVFWQELLSVMSLDMLYEKYKSKFFIICVDYSPMTGGCHFISDCKSYSQGCGNCPEFIEKKNIDHTKDNAELKRIVYKKINPVFFLNKYMNDNYASIGPVINNFKKVLMYPIIDETFFCSRDKKLVRNELGIPNDKKIIFFACQSLNDPRKGIKFVIESINRFYDKLSESERENIYIISAGSSDEKIISQIPFKNKSFGYVDKNRLTLLFAASDLFLSGAVIDAGPMMVNQALSCGIPVIAFKIGTALEVVDGKGTGYCAETTNSGDFENGIEWWYGLSESEYKEVSNKCREIAIQTTSYKACIDLLMDEKNFD